MKRSAFIPLVNITTVFALVFFVFQKKVTLHQLPVVALVSLVIVNGAALFGLRLREKRLK